MCEPVGMEFTTCANVNSLVLNAVPCMLGAEVQHFVGQIMGPYPGRPWALFPCPAVDGASAATVMTL